MSAAGPPDWLGAVTPGPRVMAGRRVVDARAPLQAGSDRHGITRRRTDGRRPRQDAQEAADQEEGESPSVTRSCIHKFTPLHGPGVQVTEESRTPREPRAGVAIPASRIGPRVVRGGHEHRRGACRGSLAPAKCGKELRALGSGILYQTAAEHRSAMWYIGLCMSLCTANAQRRMRTA